MKYYILKKMNMFIDYYYVYEVNEVEFDNNQGIKKVTPLYKK